MGDRPPWVDGKWAGGNLEKLCMHTLGESVACVALVIEVVVVVVVIAADGGTAGGLVRGQQELPRGALHNLVGQVDARAVGVGVLVGVLLELPCSATPEPTLQC